MSTSRRGPRRVLVVDDSALMREMLAEHVSSCAGFMVAGTAASGYQAIRKVHELEPDIVTLDLRMPDLGGIEALEYIMNEAPRPVVIISAQTAALAEPGVHAMMRGAIDFVAKPHGAGEADTLAFRDRLRQALHAAAMARLLMQPSRRGAALSSPPAGVRGRARVAVAVAASTGGPRALAELVPQLPGGLAAAVLIVQHMPPLFTQAFARRLDDTSALKVHEAEDGEPVQEGVVYIAPGGRHLDLERTDAGVVVRLSDAEPVWGVRPAADVLFGAVARTFGPDSVGVVLTGMGRDGAGGTRVVREVGGRTLVQDPETAVISSMPHAAAPFADEVLPLDRLGAAIAAHVAARAARRAC